MGWSSLGDGEKDDLLVRYEKDPSSIEALARDLGMRAATLQRRLQERRQASVGKAPARRKGKQPPAPDPVPVGAHHPKDGVFVLANPTDAHGVYADPYAWELALKCIQFMNPHVLTWGNDCMDFGIISRYAKLTQLPSITDELKDEARRRAELKSAAPGAELWWIADNHTLQRYNTYIWNRAPELADLEAIQFHNLVGIPQERIVEAFEAGDTLRVIHGTKVKKHPGQSVLEEINDPGNRKGRVVRSVLSGHVHRFAHIALDNGLEGLECGCLQNLRPEYIKEQRRSTNWRHGLGFARYGKDWSQIIPAPFLLKGDLLVCRLEGTELKVKVGRTYSGL